MNTRALAIATLALTTVPAFALEIGQVDTFEDGTTQNWLVNLLGFGSHPAPPTNVATGGPAGTDDNFLLLTSLGGDGPGSRLTMINGVQWSGDYLATGVTGISMNVANFGDTDLNLRLLFEKVDVAPTDVAVSTDAVFVAAGSGWTTVFFPIGLDSVTALAGTAENALTDATVIRLFHNDTATFPPSPVVGSLGVDNITAVPEPASIAALTLGVAALLRRRRRASC